MSEETILQEAERLINGDRRDSYGNASESFSRIAMGWSLILGNQVTAEQVALCMVWLKISRQISSPKRDNLVDMAGYAELADQVSKSPIRVSEEFARSIEIPDTELTYRESNFGSGVNALEAIKAFAQKSKLTDKDIAKLADARDAIWFKINGENKKPPSPKEEPELTYAERGSRPISSLRPLGRDKR